MPTEYVELRDARCKLQKWSENSRLYKLYLILPLSESTKKSCARRYVDLIDTAAEIMLVSHALSVIWYREEYPGSNWSQHKQSSFISNVKKVIDQHDFEEEFSTSFPRLYGHYMYFYAKIMPVVQTAINVKDAIKTMTRWAIFEDGINHMFRVLFVTSPAHASRIYRSKLYANQSRVDPNTSGSSNKSVRVHFFASPAQAKYQGEEMPYISVELPIENKGINLARLREIWGIDSVTIALNIEPFRMTFNPADDNWLSPLAVYDLSQQFTAPIKVYEPRVSTYTSVARRVHDRGYPLLHGLCAFAWLILGFPNMSTEYFKYLSILYGPQVAYIYMDVGEFIIWARGILIGIITALIFAPFFALRAAIEFAYRVTTYTLAMVCAIPTSLINFAIDFAKYLRPIVAESSATVFTWALELLCWFLDVLPIVCSYTMASLCWVINDGLPQVFSWITEFLCWVWPKVCYSTTLLFTMLAGALFYVYTALTYTINLFINFLHWAAESLSKTRKAPVTTVPRNTHGVWPTAPPSNPQFYRQQSRLPNAQFRGY